MDWLATGIDASERETSTTLLKLENQTSRAFFSRRVRPCLETLKSDAPTTLEKLACNSSLGAKTFWLGGSHRRFTRTGLKRVMLREPDATSEKRPSAEPDDRIRRVVCPNNKTYLSKVMNGGGQLNGDQVHAACEFLKLSPDQTEYLSQLRDWQLSRNKSRSDRIKSKLEKFKKRRLKTESSIEVDQEQNVQSHLWEYYTDIDLQLIHLFLTVPEFSENPSAIAEKIGVGESRLKSVLLKLQNWKIIRYGKGKYIAGSPKLHLSEDSAAFVTFGILNRIKTLERLRRKDSESSNEYFLSAFFSAETTFQDRFKKKLLELLKETQAQVISSEPEEIYQLNIDFFRWS